MDRFYKHKFIFEILKWILFPSTKYGFFFCVYALKG